MRIAVDAMGGDFAPEAVVKGSVDAAREFGVGVILVGDKDAVERELSGLETRGLDIQVKHASQVVTMHDSAMAPLRKKKDSSIAVATGLVKSGDAVAVVSAGHTGAAMSSAFFTLGLMKGVERPAIAPLMPTTSGHTIILDAGANVDCKPVHLLQFAVMGDVFAKKVRGVSKPKVGLLSIGEEDTKGNDLTKEAFKLLKASRLNFIGNIEGRDVHTGKADIIVCDGFIGNIVLKISEGLAEALNTLLKREIEEAIGGQLGYLLLRNAFKKFKKRIDYHEVGGAPLLGIDGISIVSHGSSSAKAIMNAVRVARDFHVKQVNRHIQDDIERMVAGLAPTKPAQRPAVKEGVLR